jgi:serine protease inhibitor
MEIFLPAKSSSLGKLEAELTPENWAAWRARFVSRSGKIELPRFELKSNYSLKVPLQSLGMVRAFHSGGTDAAQLTDMLSSSAGQAHAGPFFISSVLQSTYWKVDEEGSEAAAVTTIGVRAALARPEQQPFQMIVDRPFFCAIEDRRSGALLFVGAIHDPTA